MKILITGSSGMVGTHLSERLLEEGHDVVGVDWKPNEWNKEVDALTLGVDLRDKAKVLRTLPKDPDLILIGLCCPVYQLPLFSGYSKTP